MKSCDWVIENDSTDEVKDDMVRLADAQKARQLSKTLGLIKRTFISSGSTYKDR